MSSVIGYKYLFDIHMGIAMSGDEIVEIAVADKTAWRGSITGNSDTYINSPDIFGGEKGEGGIQGTLTALFGGPTQTAPSNMATVLQTPMPGFRRKLTVFFSGLISMMNPYPKAWKFRVRRTHAGWDGAVWYPEKCRISLTRPVSAGESQGTSETTSIGQSETLQSVNTAGTYTLTLAPTASGPITSIDEIVFSFAQNVGTENSYVTEHYLTVGDFSFNATTNVITLNTTSTFDPAVVTWLGTAHEYRIAYTQTVTTVDPLGGLGDVLIQAMNPAHMIWECYTNREWGRGFPASVLDEASFIAAADTLYAERFGLCIRWVRRDGIRAFVQSILDHVGGVIYPDRTTGKIKLKLIRDDYDRAAVPLFKTGTGLVSVTEAAVSASGKMINEVQVTYRDPVTNEDRTVRANNLASVQAAGGVTNSVSKEYKGIPLSSLAARLAKRDLRAMSPSIRRFNITLDRRGASVTPGSVLRIIDPTRGIGEITLRVGTVDYGSMGAGEIKVVALQDVFGLPSRGALTVGPPTWVPPNNRPCYGLSDAFELPYRSIYRALSAADFSFVDDNSAYLGTVMQEGQPLNTSYQTAVRSGLPESEDQPASAVYGCSYDAGPLPPPPPACDVNFTSVALLMHFDGNNNGIIVDSSANDLVVTAFNGAALSTGNKKFGTAALSLPATGSRIDLPNSSAIALGTGDFTIECWMFVSSWSGGGPIRIIRYNDRSVSGGGGAVTNQDYTFEVTQNGLNFFGAPGASVNPGSITGWFSAAVPAGTWNHIAWTRQGGVMRAFLNGALLTVTEGSATNNTNIVSVTQHTVGAGSLAGYTVQPCVIDEMRITKGVARYTASFTVPTESFPNTIC